MSKPIVEALFGRGAKAKTIQWLYLQNDASDPIGARALARQAEVAYGSIDKTLRELVESQLVVREETRYGPQYRAPHEDPRLAGLFTLIRQDSELVGHLKRALRGHGKSVVYAGVFGSFASGKTSKDSDIDVLVLATGDADRFTLLTQFGKVGEHAGREVNVQFYSVEEFGDQVRNNEPVALSILANPRIDLKGTMPWQR